MTEVADKRTVHTDALQTLGSRLSPGEKRDAIHLAVEPVVAGEMLKPGQHVGRKEDGTFGHRVEKMLGIVDPFIEGVIGKGQHFWLIVYPRQITSLHHVWEHPDFPNEIDTLAQRVLLVTERLQGGSEKWIREVFVPSIAGPESTTFEQVMAGAREWIASEKIVCLGDDLDYNFLGNNIEQFWDHFTKITGKKVPEDKRGSFFRCAC